MEGQEEQEETESQSGEGLGELDGPLVYGYTILRLLLGPP